LACCSLFKIAENAVTATLSQANGAKLTRVFSLQCAEKKDGCSACGEFRLRRPGAIVIGSGNKGVIFREAEVKVD